MRTLRVAALAAVVGFGMAVFAADYNAMSIDELNSMRGTNLPTEERAKFQEAYKAKVQALPSEEQAKYMGRPENAPQKGTGMGQGAGNGNKGGGQGNGGNGGNGKGRN